jgi:hypothetical protein
LEALDNCKITGNAYYDKDFPAKDKSIMPLTETFKPEYEDIHWKRAKDLGIKSGLGSKIHPTEVKVGNIANISFASALSIISEKSDLENLFEYRANSKCGLYSVSFYKNGIQK